MRVRSLALLLLASHPLGSCSALFDREVRVRVELSSEELCGDSGPQIERLALFLSTPALEATDGDSSRWRLRPGPTSTRDVVLLDFEGCEAVEIVGAWAGRGDPASLVATLGLPDDLNHSNPALAEGPLTDPAMHWSWQAGYKYLRFETLSSELLFHLGATGCRGLDPVDCKHPHRSEVSLALRSTPRGWSTQLFPDELLAALRASRRQLGDGHCQSTPSDADCTDLLPPDGRGLRRFFGSEASAAQASSEALPASRVGHR
ncbi:MAG: MbnP family protein [Acidobacteriota bacterium]